MCAGFVDGVRKVEEDGYFLANDFKTWKEREKLH